ncbi:hypothetical protein HDV57DRAFT_445484 [Trichoderma longibrachiatum]
MTIPARNLPQQSLTHLEGKSSNHQLNAAKECITAMTTEAVVMLLPGGNGVKDGSQFATLQFANSCLVSLTCCNRRPRATPQESKAKSQGSRMQGREDRRAITEYGVDKKLKEIPEEAEARHCYSDFDLAPHPGGPLIRAQSLARQSAPPSITFDTADRTGPNALAALARHLLRAQAAGERKKKKGKRK